MVPRLFDFKKRKSLKLAERGYRALKEDKPEQALAIAAQLEQLRYSAAFEIAALAQARLSGPAQAVATLQRGLTLAPGVWQNWQLLGNYLSDLGQADAAQHAYEKTLSCEHVDVSSVRLNQSILAERRSLYAEALAYAEQVSDPELELRALSARVAALTGLGRCDEAVGHAEAALARPSPHAAEIAERGELAAALAEARIARGDPRQEVHAAAVAALETHDRTSQQLLRVVRELDAAPAGDAPLHRLCLNIRLPDSRKDVRGFFTYYEVVADSLTEALRYIRALEVKHLTSEPKITEHALRSARGAEWKGVYARSQPMYYKR